MSAFGDHPTDCQDFRSPSLKQKRNKTRSAKYSNFRTTKPGQLEIPHYFAPKSLDPYCGFEYNWPADLSTCTVLPRLSKRQLYEATQEAATHQEWWRLPSGGNRFSHKEAENRRGTNEAKKQAAGFLKAGGYKGPCWDGAMDTHLDCPELLDEYLVCFDLCYFCGWLPEPDDHNILEPTIDFGTLVDVALEKRVRNMRKNLEEGGWVEVDQEVEWSEVDGEDLLSLAGFSDWEES